MIFISFRPTPAASYQCTSATWIEPSEIGSYRFQPGDMTKVLMEDYSAEEQPKRKAA